MVNLSRCFSVFDPKYFIRHKRPSTMIEELCHRFSLAQLQKSTNNFDPSRMIVGHHYFMGLYKGCINIGGSDYTVLIKRFKKEYDQLRSNEQLSEFKNEIQLLCQLHHPNLVSLIGFCDEKNELILVYEYMSNRSLSDHLHCHGPWYNNKPLSWKKRLEICIGAARGLHYLHTGAKHTIYHRDIRLTSILLDENWVPKLANFGISLKGPSFMSKLNLIQVNEIVGKVGYLPPEVLDCTITDKSDVFFFGIMMLEVVCREKLMTLLFEIPEEIKNDQNKAEHRSCSLAKDIRNYAEIGYAHKVINPYILGKIAPECWKIYMDIAESCLLQEATERPTMGEVELELEHALEIQEAAEEATTKEMLLLHNIWKLESDTSLNSYLLMLICKWGF